MNGQPMQPVMGGPPQPMQPQQVQQQQRIFQVILQNLRSQQLPPGWHQAVAADQRAPAVLQLYTGFRLAKPEATDQQVLQSAHQIEQNQLLKTSNKDEYTQAIRKLLTELRNMRQRNIQGAQASMMQQGNAGANMPLGLGSQTPMQPSSSNQGQNPLQQPMASQFQHQMQNSPMMGMENPAMQAQQNQPQPNMNQMPQRQQGPQFSPQEEAQINEIARKVRARLTPEDESKIRAQLAQMPPEKRAMFDKPGFDVIAMHSRQRAVAWFVNAKKQQQMQAGQAGGAQSGPQPGQGSGQGPGPAARVNSSQGAGMMQRTPQMGPAQPQSGALPGNDFDFTQLTNQQAAAMRSAQAGHDVVPASNNSAMNGLEFNPMNGGQPGPMGGQGMPGGPQSRPPSQQPSFSLQQAQQQAQRENAIRSIQAQHAAAQARNQGLSPAQMQLAMRNQQMGAGFNMGQGQGGGMPMLTRPMAPPGPQGRGTPQPGPQQMPPNVGQGMDATRALQMAQHRAAQAQAGMPGAPAPNRASRIPPEVPEPMRQTLMGLPEDKFQAIINRWAQTRQMQAGANNGQQQGQQFGLQGPRPGMPMMGANNMPPFMQQGQPQGMNPEIQHRFQQEMMLLRQQQIQQHQQQVAQHQPQRMPPLNPQALQQMDQTPFPPSIAGQIRTHAPLPDSIKLWGQLKEWVSRNPSLPASFSVERLNEIQRMHYAKITSGQGMINLGGGVPNGPVGGFGQGNPNGQAPQAPMISAGPNQSQMQQQMLRQQVARIAQSVTPADIQRIRQMQGPKAANLSDEQLRHQIIQLKMAQAQRLSQQNPQNSMPQPPPGGIVMTQPPSMQQPQRPAQPGQPQQAPQMKPAQQSQGPPRPAQPPSQPPDSTPKAQAQKGIKRPNEEGGDDQEQEKVQAPPMQPTQSQQRPTGLTKEQFEALPPQQQAAYRQRMAQVQAQGNKNASLQASNELKSKFMNMMAERKSELRVGGVVQLSNDERAQMVSDAGKLIAHLSKLDQCLFINWVKHRDENLTRKMLTLRALFHHQIDPNSRGLKQDVTLDPGKMQQLLAQLTSFMKQVMFEQTSEKAQQPNNAPEGAQPADQASGPPQGQQAELSSANLEKLRQAQQQRPRQASGAGGKPPNAPIATQPPFQLGAQSPHGAPMYAPGAVNNLTPEKLKMPPKKKAKTSASSTPQATPMPAPSPHVGTKPSPDIKREAAAPAAPFKPRFPCPQVTCELSVKGFDSKDDLASHVKEAHAKIEDPLQFAMDSLAEGLGLNPDGSTKETKNDTDANCSKPAPTAPKVQAPAKAGQTPIVKADGSTPAAGAGAAPMNRVPTQQGAKGSPSANFKTPQAITKAQTPGPGSAPAMNRTPSKAPVAKTDAMAPANAEAPAATKASLENPWDDCPLSPSQMYGMFADEDVAKAVMEMPADYFVDLNEKIATINDESGATPATTPSPASTKDSNQTTSTETSDGDSLVNVDWDKKKLQHDAEFGQMMSKLLVFDDSADMTLTLASDEQDGSGPFGFWRDKLPSTTQDIPGWEANELSEPFDFFGAPPAPSDDDALMELFPGIGKSDMDIDMPDLAM